MRWREKRMRLLVGDKRTIERFLLLPRTIMGQTRWLEWAKIKQQHEYYPYEFFGITYYDKTWSDVAWGD